MKITDITNFRINRKKRIAEETRAIENQTAALERTNELKAEALKAMIEMVKPAKSLNNELYGTGNQPYASKIWSCNPSEARRLSRIAYWESPPAQAMIGRFVDLVHGPKLELQANPVWDMVNGPKSIEERQKFVKNIESRYRLWAKSKTSDYIEDKNHYGRSRQNFESLLLEGEYFEFLSYPATRKRNPLTVKIISPDHIQCIDKRDVHKNNTEENGIEYNGKGVAVAYHILVGDGSKSKRIPKFGSRSGRQFMIHNKLGNKRRGIGILAGVITELTKLADFQALEIQAAVVNALFAMVVETQIGGENKPVFKKTPLGQTNVDPGIGTRSPISDYASQMNSTQMQHGGSIMTELGEGQTMKSLDTKRPNTNFEGFFKATLRNLFSAKGMSYDVAMYDPDSSYSAIRTNLLLLWNRIMTLRFDHACDHEDVIYKMWLMGEIEQGNIKMSGFDTNENIQDAWANATWTGPARPDIDPKKSFDAHKGEVEEGFKTRSMVTAERGGGDYDENIIRLIEENKINAVSKEPLAIQEKTTYSNNKSESKTESKSIDTANTGGK